MNVSLNALVGGVVDGWAREIMDARMDGGVNGFMD